MDTSELINAVQTLNTPDAFRPRFGAEQWRLITPFLTRHEVRGGDLLLRQGDGDRTMYFLERGNLQVFVSREPGSQGPQQKIAILRRWEFDMRQGAGADGLLAAGEMPRLEEIRGALALLGVTDEQEQVAAAH